MHVCKSRTGVGVVAAAFGAGLLVATVLPMKVTLFILAAALILLGCSSRR